MYYVFDKNGKCVCSANCELDKDDLQSRNEIAIESNEIFDIQQIKLVDGEITVPAPSLDELKAQKLAELKATRDTLETEPIEYNGSRYDYDDKARDRINAAIIALDISGQSIEWTTADNTNVAVTAQDLRNIIAAVALRSNDLHVKYRELKELVLACTTAKEVAEIVW